MSLELPESLHWLGWVAGAPWPKGMEDEIWADSRAWSDGSERLKALLDHIVTIKQATMDAYVSGEGAEEMGARFDQLRSGDQSLETIANYMHELSEAVFDFGTQVQSAKLNIIVTLCWLGVEIAMAWLFPPTAPANEAAAIAVARTVMNFLEHSLEKAVANLAAKLGASATKKYLFKGIRVLPTASEWGFVGSTAIKGAMEEMIINGAIQAGQLAAGTSHHFDTKDFLISGAGGAVGEVAGDFAAKWMNNKIASLAKTNPLLAAKLNTYWGSVLSGGLVGATADGVGGIAGNIAGALIAGQPISSAFDPQSIVGGFIQGSLPGMVGGFRNHQIEMQNLAASLSDAGFDLKELGLDGLDGGEQQDSGGVPGDGQRGALGGDNQQAPVPPAYPNAGAPGQVPGAPQQNGGPSLSTEETRAVPNNGGGAPNGGQVATPQENVAGPPRSVDGRPADGQSTATESLAGAPQHGDTTQSPVVAAQTGDAAAPVQAQSAQETAPQQVVSEQIAQPESTVAPQIGDSSVDTEVPRQSVEGQVEVGHSETTEQQVTDVRDGGAQLESDGGPVEAVESHADSTTQPVEAGAPEPEVDGQQVDGHDQPVQAQHADPSVTKDDAPHDSQVAEQVDTHGRPIESVAPQVDTQVAPIEGDEQQVDTHGQPIEAGAPQVDTHNQPIEGAVSEAGTHDQQIEADGPRVDTHGLPLDTGAPQVGSQVDVNGRPIANDGLDSTSNSADHQVVQSNSATESHHVDGGQPVVASGVEGARMETEGRPAPDVRFDPELSRSVDQNSSIPAPPAAPDNRQGDLDSVESDPATTSVDSRPAIGDTRSLDSTQPRIGTESAALAQPSVAPAAGGNAQPVAGAQQAVSGTQQPVAETSRQAAPLSRQQVTGGQQHPAPATNQPAAQQNTGPQSNIGQPSVRANPVAPAHPAVTPSETSRAAPATPRTPDRAFSLDAGISDNTAPVRPRTPVSQEPGRPMSQQHRDSTGAQDTNDADVLAAPPVPETRPMAPTRPAAESTEQADTTADPNTEQAAAQPWVPDRQQLSVITRSRRDLFPGKLGSVDQRDLQNLVASVTFDGEIGIYTDPRDTAIPGGPAIGQQINGPGMSRPGRDINCDPCVEAQLMTFAGQPTVAPPVIGPETRDRNRSGLSRHERLLGARQITIARVDADGELWSGDKQFEALGEKMRALGERSMASVTVTGNPKPVTQPTEGQDAWVVDTHATSVVYPPSAKELVWTDPQSGEMTTGRLSSTGAAKLVTYIASTPDLMYAAGRHAVDLDDALRNPDPDGPEFLPFRHPSHTSVPGGVPYGAFVMFAGPGPGRTFSPYEVGIAGIASFLGHPRFAVPHWDHLNIGDLPPDPREITANGHQLIADWFRAPLGPVPGGGATIEQRLGHIHGLATAAGPGSVAFVEVTMSDGTVEPFSVLVPKKLSDTDPEPAPVWWDMFDSNLSEAPPVFAAGSVAGIAFVAADGQDLIDNTIDKPYSEIVLPDAAPAPDAPNSPEAGPKSESQPKSESESQPKSENESKSENEPKSENEAETRPEVETATATEFDGDTMAALYRRPPPEHARQLRDAMRLPDGTYASGWDPDSFRPGGESVPQLVALGHPPGDDGGVAALALLRTFHGRPEVPGIPTGARANDEGLWIDSVAERSLGSRMEFPLHDGTARSVPEALDGVRDKVRGLGPGSSAYVMLGWHAVDSGEDTLLDAEGYPEPGERRIVALLNPTTGGPPKWVDMQTRQVMTELPAHYLTRTEDIGYIAATTDQVDRADTHRKELRALLGRPGATVPAAFRHPKVFGAMTTFGGVGPGRTFDPAQVVMAYVATHMGAPRFAAPIWSGPHLGAEHRSFVNTEYGPEVLAKVFGTPTVLSGTDATLTEHLDSIGRTLSQPPHDTGSIALVTVHPTPDPEDSYPLLAIRPDPADGDSGVVWWNPLENKPFDIASADGTPFHRVEFADVTEDDLDYALAGYRTEVGPSRYWSADSVMDWIPPAQPLPETGEDALEALWNEPPGTEAASSALSDQELAAIVPPSSDQFPGTYGAVDRNDLTTLSTELRQSDGTFEAFWDPRRPGSQGGPIISMFNGEGYSAPGRATNSRQATLAFLSSWLGKPDVAAPHTGPLPTAAMYQDMAVGQWLGSRLVEVTHGPDGTPLSIQRQFEAIHRKVLDGGDAAPDHVDRPFAYVEVRWHAHDAHGDPLFDGDGRPVLSDVHAAALVYPPGSSEPVWADPQTGFATTDIGPFIQNAASVRFAVSTPARVAAAARHRRAFERGLRRTDGTYSTPHQHPAAVAKKLAFGGSGPGRKFSAIRLGTAATYTYAGFPLFDVPHWDALDRDGAGPTYGQLIDSGEYTKIEKLYGTVFEWPSAVLGSPAHHLDVITDRLALEFGPGSAAFVLVGDEISVRPLLGVYPRAPGSGASVVWWDLTSGDTGPRAAGTEFPPHTRVGYVIAGPAVLDAAIREVEEVGAPTEVDAEVDPFDHMRRAPSAAPWPDAPGHALGSAVRAAFIDSRVPPEHPLPSGSDLAALTPPSREMAAETAALTRSRQSFEQLMQVEGGYAAYKDPLRYPPSGVPYGIAFTLRAALLPGDPGIRRAAARAFLSTFFGRPDIPVRNAGPVEVESVEQQLGVLRSDVPKGDDGQTLSPIQAYQLAGELIAAAGPGTAVYLESAVPVRDSSGAPIPGRFGQHVVAAVFPAGATGPVSLDTTTNVLVEGIPRPPDGARDTFFIATSADRVLGAARQRVRLEAAVRHPDSPRPRFTQAQDPGTTRAGELPLGALVAHPGPRPDTLLSPYDAGVAALSTLRGRPRLALPQPWSKLTGLTDAAMIEFGRAAIAREFGAEVRSLSVEPAPIRPALEYIEAQMSRWPPGSVGYVELVRPGDSRPRGLVIVAPESGREVVWWEVTSGRTAGSVAEITLDTDGAALAENGGEQRTGTTIEPDEVGIVSFVLAPADIDEGTNGFDDHGGGALPAAALDVVDTGDAGSVDDRESEGDDPVVELWSDSLASPETIVARTEYAGPGTPLVTARYLAIAGAPAPDAPVTEQSGAAPAHEQSAPPTGAVAPTPPPRVLTAAELAAVPAPTSGHFPGFYGSADIGELELLRDRMLLPDGTYAAYQDPRSTPDGDQPYGKAINGVSPRPWSRTVNCGLAVQAFLSTFLGKPAVAGGVVGKPPRDAESANVPVIQRWLGSHQLTVERLTDGTLATPAQRIEAIYDTVRRLGPGAFASVQLGWHKVDSERRKMYGPDGKTPVVDGTHSLALVFPVGADAPVWVDPQAGTMTTDLSNLADKVATAQFAAADAEMVARAGQHRAELEDTLRKPGSDNEFEAMRHPGRPSADGAAYGSKLLFGPGRGQVFHPVEILRAAVSTAVGRPRTVVPSRSQFTPDGFQFDFVLDPVADRHDLADLFGSPSVTRATAPTAAENLRAIDAEVMGAPPGGLLAGVLIDGRPWVVLRPNEPGVTEPVWWNPLDGRTVALGQMSVPDSSVVEYVRAAPDVITAYLSEKYEAHQWPVRAVPEPQTAAPSPAPVVAPEYDDVLDVDAVEIDYARSPWADDEFTGVSAYSSDAADSDDSDHGDDSPGPGTDESDSASEGSAEDLADPDHERTVASGAPAQRFGDEYLGAGYRELSAGERSAVDGFVRALADSEVPDEPVNAFLAAELREWGRQTAVGRAGDRLYTALTELNGGVAPSTVGDVEPLLDSADTAADDRAPSVAYVFASDRPDLRFRNLSEAAALFRENAEYLGGDPSARAFADRVAILDAAVARPLPESVRAVVLNMDPDDFRTAEGERLTVGDSSPVGREFSYAGFLTTKLGNSPYDSAPFQLELTLPQGTPALWLGTEAGLADDGVLMLPRGTTFRVTGVSTKPVWDSDVVIAEVVGAQPRIVELPGDFDEDSETATATILSETLPSTHASSALFPLSREDLASMSAPSRAEPLVGLYGSADAAALDTLVATLGGKPLRSLWGTPEFARIMRLFNPESGRPGGDLNCFRCTVALLSTEAGIPDVAGPYGGVPYSYTFTTMATAQRYLGAHRVSPRAVRDDGSPRPMDEQIADLTRVLPRGSFAYVSVTWHATDADGHKLRSDDGTPVTDGTHALVVKVARTGPKRLIWADAQGGWSGPLSRRILDRIAEFHAVPSSAQLMRAAQAQRTALEEALRLPDGSQATMRHPGRPLAEGGVPFGSATILPGNEGDRVDPIEAAEAFVATIAGTPTYAVPERAEYLLDPDRPGVDTDPFLLGLERLLGDENNPVSWVTPAEGADGTHATVAADSTRGTIAVARLDGQPYVVMFPHDPDVREPIWWDPVAMRAVDRAALSATATYEVAFSDSDTIAANIARVDSRATADVWARSSVPPPATPSQFDGFDAVTSAFASLEVTPSEYERAALFPLTRRELAVMSPPSRREPFIALHGGVSAEELRRLQDALDGEPLRTLWGSAKFERVLRLFNPARREPGGETNCFSCTMAVLSTEVGIPHVAGTYRGVPYAEMFSPLDTAQRYLGARSVSPRTVLEDGSRRPLGDQIDDLLRTMARGSFAYVRVDWHAVDRYGNKLYRSDGVTPRVDGAHTVVAKVPATGPKRLIWADGQRGWTSTHWPLRDLARIVTFTAIPATARMVQAAQAHRAALEGSLRLPDGSFATMWHPGWPLVDGGVPFGSLTVLPSENDDWVDPIEATEAFVATIAGTPTYAVPERAEHRLEPDRTAATDDVYRRGLERLLGDGITDVTEIGWTTPARAIDDAHDIIRSDTGRRRIGVVLLDGHPYVVMFPHTPEVREPIWWDPVDMRAVDHSTLPTADTIEWAFSTRDRVVGNIDAVDHRAISHGLPESSLPAEIRSSPASSVARTGPAPRAPEADAYSGALSGVGPAQGQVRESLSDTALPEPATVSSESAPASGPPALTGEQSAVLQAGWDERSRWGLISADIADQLRLEAASRGSDGEFRRFPDPRSVLPSGMRLVGLINGPGLFFPGRAGNCDDTSLAWLLTHIGMPRVARPFNGQDNDGMNAALIQMATEAMLGSHTVDADRDAVGTRLSVPEQYRLVRDTVESLGPGAFASVTIRYQAVDADGHPRFVGDPPRPALGAAHGIAITFPRRASGERDTGTRVGRRAERFRGYRYLVVFRRRRRGVVPRLDTGAGAGGGGSSHRARQRVA